MPFIKSVNTFFSYIRSIYAILRKSLLNYTYDNYFLEDSPTTNFQRIRSASPPLCSKSLPIISNSPTRVQDRYPLPEAG